MQPASPEHVQVLVIGSGFGGTMTSIPIAATFAARGKGERVRILERGTWWTTPHGTVTDPEVEAERHLRKRNKQPVQFWSAVNSFRGVIDIVLRCVRRSGNDDGLFDFTFFGKKGFLGIFGRKSDGVSILRAAGVGGGSLIYSNVTIQPPDFVFEDERWVSWPTRVQDFALAHRAIADGVWSAVGGPDKVYQGLHNITTRTAGLDPKPTQPQQQVTRIGPLPAPGSADHPFWLDRARVFQRAMEQLTDDYGTVDSSIADRPFPDPNSQPAFNYCDRQGRCNLGCLPGARYTLNKQLMLAMFGKPAAPPLGQEETPSKGPLGDFLQLEALAEVDVIVPRPQGGYEVEYVVRDPRNPRRTTARTVTADRVVLAAGCVGTTEILMRSKARGHLPDLSPALGSHFSTNGDYIAFLEGTAQNFNLVRGPVTTSFAHFNAPSAGKGGTDQAQFHTIEDQGVPPALASLVGSALPFIRRVGNHAWPKLFVFLLLLAWAWRRFWSVVKALFVLHRTRTFPFLSPEEQTSRIMCIAAMGREASVGRFRLGGAGESPLRVARDDNRPFHADPIYGAIRGSLAKFAGKIRAKGKTSDFQNPFLTPAADALGAKSITLSHPLGGCPMGGSPESGAVDDRGQVFNARTGGRYDGLYVADASIIPTALGVNPSLTISALALRVARGIVGEIQGAPPPW